MKKLIALCATALFTLSSQATLLSVDLDSTDYQIGDTLQANIIVSDIEQDDFGFQKLLASFDFDLLFDDSLLSYQSTTFGGSLDVDPFFASSQLAFDTGFNSVYVSELSFAFSSDLFAAQDGLSEFVLATVSFDVLGSGVAAFDFANILLGDDFGAAFTSVSSESSRTSISGATSVPEMPSLAIFALGLIAFVVRQRKA